MDVFWTFVLSEGWGDLSAGSLPFSAAGKELDHRIRSGAQPPNLGYNSGRNIVKHYFALLIATNPPDIMGLGGLPRFGSTFTMPCIEITSITNVAGWIGPDLCCGLVHLELAAARRHGLVRAG